MSDESAVVVYTASDPMQAAQLQGELRAAGFLCELLNVQNTTMLLGGGICIGVRMIVPASQAEDAKAFIDDTLKKWAEGSEERSQAGVEETAPAAPSKGVLRCGNCGGERDADATFCDQCGAQLPPVD